MKLRYRLTGTGWAEASLENAGAAVTVTASYLSDALGNFARGALAVMRGSGEARFSFDEEPGEFRWIFKMTSPETYTLSILQFDELWGNKPDEKGIVIFEDTISRVEIGKMALKTLEDVRHEYGDSGYKDKWHEHEFPAAELFELRSLLNEK